MIRQDADMLEIAEYKHLPKYLRLSGIISLDFITVMQIPGYRGLC